MPAAACYNHWFPERQLPAMLPRWHYLHIHNDVIPAPGSARPTRFSSFEFRVSIFAENPRKIFEKQGAY